MSQRFDSAEVENYLPIMNYFAKDFHLINSFDWCPVPSCQFSHCQSFPNSDWAADVHLRNFMIFSGVLIPGNWKNYFL